MNHVSCLIRTKAIMNVNEYEGGKGFSEDWWLWANCLLMVINSEI